MKQFFYLMVSSILCLSMVACSQDKPSSNSQGNSTTPTSSTISVTHDLGVTQAPLDAQNIVVLDLAILDMLDSLGLGDRVTGIPKQSSVSYLTSYIEDSNVVNLGSLKEIDMEALNALSPDIIFIGGRLASEYENISKIAPTILLSVDNSIGYMNSFSSNLNTVASLFGLEEKAENLMSGLNERIATLQKTASGKTALVNIVTSGSISTLGSNSRCSLIVNEIGFENMSTQVDSTHGDNASFELLLEKNPDYIFVLDRDTAINAQGAKTAKEVMENEIIMKTKAYENGTIVYLTPDIWYLSEGGITATDMMLRDIEVAILKN